MTRAAHDGAARRPFTRLESTLVALSAENVDTDQIIPARFLKVTTRTGLGAHLFADWRHDADGVPDPRFPLNRAERREAQVLVAGDNFGCGSSREHAAWALVDHGFRAVVSTAFADIFRSNALKNGLLPVVVPGPAHARLLELAESSPPARVVIDVAEQTLALPDGTPVGFPLEPFARYRLLEGIDELDVLLGTAPEIDAYEAAHPPPVRTLAGEPT